VGSGATGCPADAVPEETDERAGPDPGGAPREDAWVALYRETVPELYRRLSRRAGGDAALAEDLTQEAWLRMLREFGRGPLPRDPLAWLTTTATNLLRNLYRARREPPDTTPPDLAAAEPLEPDSTAAALVQWGLARLRPAEASLLEAFHLDGRSQAELAAALGTTPRAVEGRLRRARQRFERVVAARLGPTSSREGLR